jgi:hypothetical protein
MRDTASPAVSCTEEACNRTQNAEPSFFTIRS